MRNISYVFFLIAILSLPQSGNAQLIQDRRCDKWGDSLGGPEATERIAFALSCEKDARILREIRVAQKGVIAKDGSSSSGYPSYGRYNDIIVDFDNPKNWFAPPTTKGSCTDIPADYEIAFFCAAGCYTPEQEILSTKGSVSVQQASWLRLPEVQTLTAHSQVGNLKYQSSEVASYIFDARPGDEEVLRFKTQSGGTLRVTLNHPLVNAAGEIAQAQSFKVGDALVKMDGELDPILSIETENYFGKVYNLRMASEDLKENILVAQGYLNGSARYQNEYVKQHNRQLLRSIVAHRLLGQE